MFLDDEGDSTNCLVMLPDSEVKWFAPADIIASMSYFFNLLSGIGYTII